MCYHVDVVSNPMDAPAEREVSHLLKPKVGHLLEGPTSLRMYTRLRSCTHTQKRSKHAFVHVTYTIWHALSSPTENMEGPGLRWNLTHEEDSMDRWQTSIEEKHAAASSKHTVTSSEAPSALMCIPATRMRMEVTAEVCNRCRCKRAPPSECTCRYPVAVPTKM